MAGEATCSLRAARTAVVAISASNSTPSKYPAIRKGNRVNARISAAIAAAVMGAEYFLAIRSPFLPIEPFEAQYFEKWVPRGAYLRGVGGQVCTDTGPAT